MKALSKVSLRAVAERLYILGGPLSPLYHPDTTEALWFYHLSQPIRLNLHVNSWVWSHGSNSGLRGGNANAVTARPLLLPNPRRNKTKVSRTTFK
jgi:hypothetical protein